MIGRYRFNWRKYETELSMLGSGVAILLWLAFWFVVVPLQAATP